MTNPKNKNLGLLSAADLDSMLKKADELPNRYFQLRAKALVGLLKKFGKRRAELADLKIIDFLIENEQLLVTFNIRKKHKKGLFQYLKVLKKSDPQALDKPLSQLQLDWKAWTLTKEGQRIKEDRRTKGVALSDRYAKLIIDYLEFLKQEYPKADYFFPSGKTVYGTNYVVFEDIHLSGRQMLRLIKPLNPKVWMHLFREMKGAEIARTEGNRMNAIYDVRDTLDLENEETAYRYVRRYAIQVMKKET